MEKNICISLVCNIRSGGQFDETSLRFKITGLSRIFENSRRNRYSKSGVKVKRVKRTYISIYLSTYLSTYLPLDRVMLFCHV